MNFSRRNIVIAFVLLVGVFLVYILNKNSNSLKLDLTPTPTPTVEQKIEEKFSVLVPDNLEKAILVSKDGGESEGISTRKFANGKFNLTILSSLAELVAPNYYSAWLVSGTEGTKDYKVMPLGKMRLAKGGWIIDFNATKDYSDYRGVIISTESKEGKAPSNTVLGGSF